MTQTIALLQTCDAGVKTAVNSLENALRKTQDEGLRRQLQRSLAEHRALGSELKQALEAEQAGGKPPSAMARDGAGKDEPALCLFAQRHHGSRAGVGRLRHGRAHGVPRGKPPPGRGSHGP